jgi:hypothetical protein
LVLFSEAFMRRQAGVLVAAAILIALGSVAAAGHAAVRTMPPDEKRELGAVADCVAQFERPCSDPIIEPVAADAAATT